MTVQLADIIAVLDAAYPPSLAQSWDSVGLVCGDPNAGIDSVTLAVDATAAVVDAVGQRGLLLAHHPLLLRGVDTVAANTPKGALIHQLIRHDSALFTAHTNADAANPGVSDALADLVGITVDAVLAPSDNPVEHQQRLDKWIIFVPPEHADAVRTAVFNAGAGCLGDYSQCSWSVTGTGQFLPHDGATPVIGTIGAVERVVEDRVEVVAPAQLRGVVLAALRAAHPYEEPAFDVVPMADIPARPGASTSVGTGIGRVGSLKQPLRLAEFVAQIHAVLPLTTWGVRAAGNPDTVVSRVAVCGGAGDSLLAAAQEAGASAYITADLRHHPADEHRRASDVALIDIAHWASEYPWCMQAAQLLRDHFGAALAVTVCDIRTDPWNIEYCVPERL